MNKTMNKSQFTNMAQRQKPTNIGSKLMKNDENERLFRILGKGCVTLATSVVQLLSADPPRRSTWTVKCCGVVCFVKDNPNRSYFIRIYNVKEEQLLFEQELYTEFKYETPLPYFHTFEAEKYQAALNFCENSSDEAFKFKRSIEDKLNARNKRKMERKNTRARRQESKEKHKIPPSRPPPPSQTGSKEVKITKLSVTAAKQKGKTSKDGDKKGKLTKKDIGSPTGFQHVTHLGYDSPINTSLTVENLNPEMKDLFKGLGYGEKHIVKPDDYVFVNDFVAERGGMAEFQKQLDKTPTASVPSPNLLSDYENISTTKSQQLPPPIPTTPPAVFHQTKPRHKTQKGQQHGPHVSTVASTPHPPPFAPPPVAKAANGQPTTFTPPTPPPLPNGPAVAQPTLAPPPPPSPPVVAPPPPPNAPPPPPSMAMPSAEQSLIPPVDQTTGRGALLEQIRSGGKPLRKTTVNETSDSRGDLLSAIRAGTSLKHVNQTDQNHRLSQTLEQEESGVLGALARALADRNKHIQISDDELDSDEDDDDTDDDDDWDD